MNDVYREICEEQGWGVFEDDDGVVELEKYSPAGEDFSFTARADHFVEDAKEYAASFDQEEHIEMWIEAKRNGVRGVPFVKELVRDAEAINEMLRELATALQNTQLEDERESTVVRPFEKNFSKVQ